ncbi:tRNA (adenosine(37)-N6)-threonylcarbamoyltransferase complex dimerization subunit type 1 TsaB [Aliishimia ponticola]|uniref:tRNA (Adenosine(37)-N6)-threonylcarbamoyltransferase complex dimerization subunit type 1 TsaB n=1 Tax=Aliishimia ponticola TaxID=2499833 RepID=A0A4S4NBZ8_9RHOB|nr:tRNA (adenosine(37)-N6)-threonylcarbamoyltransferase complex dimerization subunit type 1 TsaB [Aliishimia ponticola]THH35997.1 tRNA (adenosine(37)-N6)-threonylcarbamoyltransferase complex dimerization subunit type 1 TsaB [Aliishimia ponticola]
MRSDAKILAFDTSAAHCAAALLCGDEILDQRCEEMTRGQAERLMPLLDSLLQAQGIGWRDLDRIGVGIGPGNFTGIRISVAAARGLALGLGIPAIGVSMFQTTQKLADSAQTAIPAPREQAYALDTDTMTAPIMAAQADLAGFTLSTAFTATDHVATIARIARDAPDQATPPAPLYIRPADAAPPRDPAPVILDDA